MLYKICIWLIIFIVTAAFQLVTDPDFSNPNMWIAMCANCEQQPPYPLLTNQSHGPARPLQSGHYMFFTPSCSISDTFWLGTVLWQSDATTLNLLIEANDNTADVLWQLSAQLYTGSMLVEEKELSANSLNENYRNLTATFKLQKALDFPNIKFIIISHPADSWSTIDNPTGWLSINYVSVESE